MDYKEKLRLAKEALDSGSYDKETIEYIFPELKENDNTRVKNKLIEFFKGYYPDKEWWGNITQRDILTWFEEHGEQISNFKVGDIIKRPNNKVTYEVTNIDDHGFQLDGGHWFKLDRKSEFELVEQKPVNKVEPKFKVGDIVRNIDSGELFHIEKVDSRNYWDGRDSFYIINQEQWERVEQKSSWSKEDEMQLDAAIHLVSSTGHIETTNWLKSIKDRVQLQPKPAWSEEDEMYLIHVTNAVKRYFANPWRKDVIKWLNSLKDRYTWKPSDEQFKLLKHIMENVPLSYIDKSEVGGLYLDLKRLIRE